MAAEAGRDPQDVGEIVRNLPPGELRSLLLSAVDRHADVERQVRLVALRTVGDLTGLRAEVDRGLRTRRFLAYRESSEWALAARPIIDELRVSAAKAPSNDLVLLLQRAVGHVVKMMMHADDSDGTIGDLAREILSLHAIVCDAGCADPGKLAGWMVTFSCDEQDCFELDPVRYANALGERGLFAYRDAIAKRTDADECFAVGWARERLAILDGDTDALIELLGGDLSSPHQFVRISEAMAELGRDDDVLVWTRRGSPRLTVGRSPSSMTSPATSTNVAAPQSRCLLCVASSTSEPPRRAHTERCVMPPSRFTHGSLSVTTPALLPPGRRTPEAWRVLEVVVFQFEEFEEFADVVAVLGGVAHGDLVVDAVAVPASDFLAGDVSGFDQVSNDSLGRAIADSDAVGEIADARVRVPVEAEQDLSVVGQEPPSVFAV